MTSPRSPQPQPQVQPDQHTSQTTVQPQQGQQKNTEGRDRPVQQQPVPQTQLNPQAGEVSIEKGSPARP